MCIRDSSERALLTFYKFSALWGGQAGSLLFWCLILSIYSAIVAFANRQRHQVMMPYVNSVLLTTSLFFLVLLVFAADPFKRVGFVPPDGQGLNPLLQNYWMIIHPVMLYLGYVGMAVPFAFAVGALLSKRVGNEWVRTVRRWTLIPWLFLSLGIIMGSQWAYMELGWGGYWAWDPVENASFLPWLTAIAAVHSALVLQRKGTLRAWTVILVVVTFLLTILGTFLTRSGVVNSVHSFTQTPIGPAFLAFLGFCLVASVVVLAMRMDTLASDPDRETLWTREGAFLVNNLLLLVFMFLSLIHI